MNPYKTFIALNPAFPDHCFNSLSGWLLRNTFQQIKKVVDGVAFTTLVDEGRASPPVLVDEDFIKFFMESTDDDPFKMSLIESNSDLRNGVTLGAAIDTESCDILHMIQRVIAGNPTYLSVVELMLLKGYKNAPRGSISGYAVYITAEQIAEASLVDMYKRACAACEL